MKTQSPFTHAMDALRPRPARRTAMLQSILATRQPPLGLRQWRWALAAVPTVAALVLGLAWSLGAYDANHAAAPDKVTQAATSITTAAPSATATSSAMPHNNTSAVVWLTQVRQSSARVGLGLPTSLELVRTQIGQLTQEESQSIVQKLQSAGWQSVQVASVQKGLYTISAKKKAIGGQDTDDAVAAQIFGDSGMLGIASQKQYIVDVDMPAFYGPAYALQRDSVRSGYRYSADRKQGFLNVQLEVGLVRYEHMGFVKTLTFAEAVKNAFLLQGSKMQVDSDAPIEVVSADLVMIGGVPCYRFLVCSSDGVSAYGYALAIEESALTAQPELAVKYQDFLNGKEMHIDVADGYPENPQQFITAQLLPNLSLDSSVRVSDLPQGAALFDAAARSLAGQEQTDIADKLMAKGWSDIWQQSTDDGLLIRAKCNDDGANGGAVSREKIYEKFLEDAGLPESLAKKQITLREPSFAPQSSIIQVSAGVQGIVVPGFLQIGVYPDNTIKFLLRTDTDQLLQSATLLALTEALPAAVWFREMPAPWIVDDAAAKVTWVELIYVRGIPFYHMKVQSPESNDVLDAYALAVEKSILQKYPKTQEQYDAFMAGRIEPDIGGAMISINP